MPRTSSTCSVGRLENIIARNRRANRPKERTIVMLVVGLALLVILGLMVFTDLGIPPSPKRPPGVDDVLLRKAPK